jgi:multidrug efflux pump subunit AcrB
MKEWILHAVLAWQVTLISPEEQKTVLLQFDNGTECRSVAQQVEQQVKAAKSVFYLKSISCRPCIEVIRDKSRCPVRVKKTP